MPANLKLWQQSMSEVHWKCRLLGSTLDLLTLNLWCEAQGSAAMWLWVSEAWEWSPWLTFLVLRASCASARSVCPKPRQRLLHALCTHSPRQEGGSPSQTSAVGEPGGLRAWGKKTLMCEEGLAHDIRGELFIFYFLVSKFLWLD